MCRRFRIIFIVVVFSTALAVSSCGEREKPLSPAVAQIPNSSSSVQDSPDSNSNQAGKDSPDKSEEITRDTFTLEFEGGLTANDFDMSVVDVANGGAEVRIDAANATGIRYALFNLKYDAQRFAPTAIDFGDFFGDDVLTTGITTVAGNVGLAVVPVHYDEKPPVSGRGLIARVEFETRNKRSVAVSRTRSAYRPDDVFVLTGRGDTGFYDYTGAIWPMLLIGDGDVSGEVTVADITPIANDYLALVSENPVLDVVDYDGDGEIGIPDITPIAQNYLMRIDGYHVYYDTVDEFDPATATIDGEVTFEDMNASPVYEESGFLQFQHEFCNIPVLGETWYYSVVPYYLDGTEQTELDSSYASQGLEVVGWRYDCLPPLALRFIIQVIGNGLDESFESRELPYDLDLTANESYTFRIVEVYASLWNEEQLAYMPIWMNSTHPDWFSMWEMDIMWNTDASTDAFSFNNPTGSGAIGTCGPDDPYTFQITGFLGTAAFEKTVTLNVTVSANPKPPLVHTYTIRIAGPNQDQEYLSRSEDYELALTANDNYIFEIVSVNIAFWNENEMVYDPPITIDHTHPEWRTNWDTDIRWSADASQDVFSFDVPEGSGAIGTCGPYNPNEFEITSFLNAAAVAKTVTLNATVNMTS